MLEVNQVTVAYGARKVLDQVTATFGPDPAAITGPSGSGKSTLLRIIAGHQRPDEGRVALDGTAVSVSNWRVGSDRRIAYVFQDYRLVPFLTITENLLLATEVRNLAEDRVDVIAALDRVGLSADHADRLPETLSGGEQQRAAIARALVCGATVLVADEPTGALDGENSMQVAKILLDLGRTDGFQVVVATHDPLVADLLPHRYELFDGNLQART